MGRLVESRKLADRVHVEPKPAKDGDQRRDREAIGVRPCARRAKVAGNGDEEQKAEQVRREAGASKPGRVGDRLHVATRRRRGRSTEPAACACAGNAVGVGGDFREWPFMFPALS